MAYIGRITTAADALPRAANRRLGDIPAAPAWPLLGNVLELRTDLLGYLQQCHTAYGELFQLRFLFGERVVIALGAAANELVLQDADDNFSSRRGWDALRRLWGDTILTRDFEDHRAFRKLFTPAFKANEMRNYLQLMNTTIATNLRDWPEQAEILFYPKIKHLTLDIAGAAFAGLDSTQLDELRPRFAAAMAAPSAPFPWPLPATTLWRGKRAIKQLLSHFEAMVPSRRAAPGADMFSQFCIAHDKSGQTLSSTDIARNMMTFLFAAHDTTTVALTNLMYGLARHPQWQERLRNECANKVLSSAAGADDQDGIDYAELPLLVQTEWAFKESLRLYSPLQFIARRTIRAQEFAGRTIPANSQIMVFPHFTHHMTTWYWQPEKFDPERFAPPRAEDKQHPYAFVPFGKGSHMCLGMHFALMEVRATLFQLLRRYEFRLPPGYELSMRTLPWPLPDDGLPLQIERID